jgi:CheY-like chemotaxis protein
MDESFGAEMEVLDDVEPVTMLIVEDEDPIRDGLVEAFEGFGHEVLTATNGEEGLERFIEAGHLDIIFTDLGMPKLSGWELIEKIREIDRLMPIVVLSGWGDELDPEKIQKFGIAKVIAKPFSISDLHVALYETLISKHLPDHD